MLCYVVMLNYAILCNTLLRYGILGLYGFISRHAGSYLRLGMYTEMTVFGAILA